MLEDIPVTILQNKDGVVTDDMVIATIPIYYRGNVWNKNIVIDAHKELDGIIPYHGTAYTQSFCLTS